MSIAATDIHRDTRLNTVLIVDDDQLVIRAMSLLLSKCGFRPVVSATAGDALAQARQEIAAAVVDIHLPDMNGLELTQQLREQLGPEAPILILSGDTSMETLRALPQVGATYFFSKPVNAEMLMQRLKDCLEGKS